MKAHDRAMQWLNSPIDEKDHLEIRSLLEAGNEKELEEAFYKTLDFGTGGLRGIMGIGTNRMNKYTVGMATQGLANYLKKIYGDQEISVAIAFDSRNNSENFARIASDVLLGNNIHVYRFRELRPTPELSFAIRHLGCQSGIVITASHNPREYNGYKVYWQDGGQITNPHDQNIIKEINQIKDLGSVNFSSNGMKATLLGPEIDESYFSQLEKIASVGNSKTLKIVYSPIHGTGITMVPKALKRFGFENVFVVEKQSGPNGNFPTVVYPNPEEKEAMTLALQEAEKVDADLVMATDPDADRVGIAAKNLEGKFELLNGNQTGVLVMHYLMDQWIKQNNYSGKEFIAKTVVTTELIDAIAKHFDIACYNTLTGFKYIAELIRVHEGEEQFIAGCEESYGYMIGDFVRDKDAVSACLVIAELAQEAASQGQTLFEHLVDLYVSFGIYQESLVSLTKKGKQGEAEIKRLMASFRSNPPETINGDSVTIMIDHLNQVKKDLHNNSETSTGLPASDVLQFYTENNSKISLRPSGTEPKIKFYISVWDTINDTSEYQMKKSGLDRKITDIASDLGI